jgi:hypothetical protein
MTKDLKVYCNEGLCASKGTAKLNDNGNGVYSIYLPDGWTMVHGCEQREPIVNKYCLYCLECSLKKAGRNDLPPPTKGGGD